MDDCNFELCMYSVGQSNRPLSFCLSTLPSGRWYPPSHFQKIQEEAKERQIMRITGKSVLTGMFSSGSSGSGRGWSFDHVCSFGPKWRLDPTMVHFHGELKRLWSWKSWMKTQDCLWCEPTSSQVKHPCLVERRKICCYATDELLKDIARAFHISEHTPHHCC